MKRTRRVALAAKPPSAATVPPAVAVSTPEERGPAPLPLEVARALDQARRILGHESTWPEPGQRELAGHLAELGLAPGLPHALEEVAAAELALAREWDPEVSPAEMAHGIAQAVRAQSLNPVPHRALFAFTRLVDARFRLTPAVVDALAAEAGSEEALLEAIDRGPGAGALVVRTPKSRIELVASLVRQLALGAGASLQLEIRAEEAAWLESTVRALGAPFSESMGGASAFCANISAALGQIDTRFFTREPLPTKVDAAFHPEVAYLGADGAELAREDAVDAGAPLRINLSCEYRYGVPYPILGRPRLRIDGALREVRPGGTGRVILGTPTDFEPGFGAVTPEALEQLGRQHALFFAVGPHYFTRGSSEAARAKALEFARQLERMKAANPRLLRHYQYVVPKKEENEVAVLRALAGQLDSISLNAVELPGLLSRLAGGGLGREVLAAHAPRERAEEVALVLEAASVLREALKLGRVHIHCAAGDLCIQPTPDDLDRMVLSHLRARQLASMKAANVSGQVRDAEDLWTLAPLVTAQGLAGVRSFARALAARFQLSEEARRALLERWYWADASTGLTWSFVPTRGIHEDTGGKVSLGDTMDAVPLLLRGLPR